MAIFMGEIPSRSTLFTWTAILLTTLATCSACPNADFITPCTCRPAAFGPQVVCTNVHLLRVFQRVFDVLKDYELATLVIHRMKIRMMPNDLFNGLRVTMIRIVDSELAFERQHPQPFLGLENSLQHLDILNCDIKGSGVDSLQLSHLSRLADVQIENTNIRQLTRNWFSEGPETLEVLTLENNHIRSVEESVFSGLSNINTISLAMNDLASITRGTFPLSGCNLEVLDLSHNNLTSLPYDMFEDMPCLTRINLTNNKIVTLDEETWSPIWGQLEVLSLNDNPIHCDHNLQWIASRDLPLHLEAKCATPEILQNVSLQLYLQKNKRRRRNQ